MPLYRIYIDEVGNDGMRRESLESPNDQYLSLTGIILEAESYKKTFHHALFDLKSTFIPDYPDDPPGTAFCLHRKDILNRRNGFEFLHDHDTRDRFDNAILDIIKSTDFTVISVVIDKLAHLDTYGSFHKPPYFYCLEVILERYIMFLENQIATGDVMVEARNKKKDKQLKQVYRDFFEHGTDQISHDRMQAQLSSKEIKIKPKVKDVYGLQLADLIAYPSYSGIKRQHLKQELPKNFGGLIFDILSESKYYRVGNRIWGIGKKWLP